MLAISSSIVTTTATTTRTTTTTNTSDATKTMATWIPKDGSSCCSGSAITATSHAIGEAAGHSIVTLEQKEKETLLQCEKVAAKDMWSSTQHEQKQEEIKQQQASIPSIVPTSSHKQIQQQRRRRHDTTTTATAKKARRKKILCLGVSYPCLQSTVRARNSSSGSNTSNHNNLQQRQQEQQQSTTASCFSFSPVEKVVKADHERSVEVVADEDDGNDVAAQGEQQEPQTTTLDMVSKYVLSGALTQMDGRDLARCISTEKHCNVDVYTVSREQGAMYRKDRHLDANFNRDRAICKAIHEHFLHNNNNNNNKEKMMRRNTNNDESSNVNNNSSNNNLRQCSIAPSSWDGGGTDGYLNVDAVVVDDGFDQILLDYYWIPPEWNVSHWNVSFFQRTLPSYVEQKIISPTGKIYLPFCLHCFQQVLASWNMKLKYYFNISFLRQNSLHEIAFWYGTQQIDKQIMQNVFGKRLDQEEVYCTFGPRAVAGTMENALISKEEVISLARSLEDFDKIRFIVLEPIQQHQKQEQMDSFQLQRLLRTKQKETTSMKKQQQSRPQTRALSSMVSPTSFSSSHKKKKKIGSFLGCIHPDLVQRGFDQHNNHSYQPTTTMTTTLSPSCTRIQRRAVTPPTITVISQDNNKEDTEHTPKSLFVGTTTTTHCRRRGEKRKISACSKTTTIAPKSIRPNALFRTTTPSSSFIMTLRSSSRYRDSSSSSPVAVIKKRMPSSTPPQVVQNKKKKKIMMINDPKEGAVMVDCGSVSSNNTTTTTKECPPRLVSPIVLGPKEKRNGNVINHHPHKSPFNISLSSPFNNNKKDTRQGKMTTTTKTSAKHQDGHRRKQPDRACKQNHQKI